MDPLSNQQRRSYRLPPLRHQFIPTHHYPQSRVRKQRGAAHDGPISITAALLAVVVAYSPDRVGKRSPFISGFQLIMVVGFSMCIATTNPRIAYSGVFVAACAVYLRSPVSLCGCQIILQDR